MPRPTVAQLLYGAATVVFSTLAMLLLSQTSSGPGVGVIAVSALCLGLLVALWVPVRKPTAAEADDQAHADGEAAKRVPAQGVRTPAHASKARRVREREPAGP
ncbi:hypothetical protein OKJ48_20030 [Streptomyces kunmingensis]|uniref:Secreted protein n=1 Tax=Streptomyces kunmingensis TaxID=68225 RepID=A0ABU6CF72_9ACTN|nr:hypothetical protein [Streptomyces kunmingensis]MEB3962525.1 hypothetical protein [Streptomyces kunmingensis]